MKKKQGKMAQIFHSKKVDFENELDSLSEDTFLSKMKSFLYLEPSRNEELQWL